MSAVPARFTFDLDLGDNPQRASFVNDAARAALLQQARAEGHAEGFAAGRASAEAASADAFAAAASRIAERAADLLGGLDQTRSTLESEAVNLAAAVARKLAGRLVATQPAAELEALLVECLASLEGVPHLVIRCHPDLAVRMREVATARVSNSGFAGRLIVMGEPEIALGDGRLEWADGGLVRDSEAIAANIDRCIADYLAAPGEPQNKET
ncbi:MAG: FliH/SctL family protein [Devosia sp.]|nr:FliH/SctL family protein [Devosia sp.]